MEVSPITFVALGDCNTCGIPEAAGEIVPALVAAGLQEYGDACSLVNLGFTMSTTREGLAKLRDFQGPIDLLLINYGLVDAWTTSLPGIYLSYYPDNFLKSFGRRMLKSIKRRLRNPTLRKRVPVGEVVPLAEYEANLRSLVAHARERSPQGSIILWGTAPVRDQPARNQMIDRYNATMKSVADASHDVLYCDTSRVVSRLEQHQIYLDDVHLSPTAASDIASAILALWKMRRPTHVNESTPSKMTQITAPVLDTSSELRRSA